MFVTCPLRADFHSGGMYFQIRGWDVSMLTGAVVVNDQTIAPGFSYMTLMHSRAAHSVLPLRFPPITNSSRCFSSSSDARFHTGGT